ncbi:MAG: hypothetical protein NC344_09480 [Bacteroidales bacterium]|nr:hypothetical protein [Bacteroidales bacterium]MCM1148036.1 hypothetical protein [Bacteroidales bacterium]MCM1206853.1 hypothetical protein [Bacillota bacterium]MCM1511006.1 hypothetical protein [Clostridium sp.]
MVKTLRFMMVALVAMVCNAAFADAYKTLTFPDEGDEGKAVNNYSTVWNAKKGADTWTISYFNTFKFDGWTYIKCGHQKTAYKASIATDFAMDKAIGSVMVRVDNIADPSYVNEISLVVAEDAAFSNIVETVKAPKIEAGDITFKPASPKAGLYYKVIFDCPANGKKNGAVQVSKVEYYEDGDDPVIVDITNTPETAYTVAKAKALVAAGEGLQAKVYVKGYITAITEVSTSYGNATYTIADTKGGADDMLVYRGYYLDGGKFTAEDQIAVGDEVVVYGQLMLYSGAPQIGQGNQLYSVTKSTTGISNVEAAKDGKQVVYTIGGQQLEKAQKGLNIINGKKVVVK